MKSLHDFFLVALGKILFVFFCFFTALLGLVFKENHNPAFANFRMLSYFGYAVTYAATAVMCQATQIYVTSGIICLSIASYISVEILLRRRGEVTNLLYQSL